METVLMLILGLIFTGIFIGFILRKDNIIKLLCLTMVVYFSFYIIVSGLCFWLDIFSVVRVLWILCFGILPLDIIYLLKQRTFEIEWEIKRYIFPVLIVFCALPFVLTKYEFFGMGQDEGVYQTQAIQFIYDYNDIQRDFEEYEMLHSEEAKMGFQTSIQEDLIGLYNYDTTLPFASEEKELSDVSATFHGIPTIAALLAIFGKIFGIHHMSDIQTIFYICSVFLLFFILTDMGVKKVSCAVCTILFAFSPIVLWVSKSALTEMGLACLILAFIYFILKMDKKGTFLSIVPLTAFCFYHLTIYTMVPVFIMVYFGLYIYNRKNYYLVSAAIFNTVFMAGMVMAMMIAGTYSFTYNFVPLYRFKGVNQNNVCAFIMVMGIIVYIICILLYIIRKNLKKIKELYQDFKVPGMRLILSAGVLYQGVIIFRIRERYQGGINSLKHLTIVGYGLNVGIIIPIVAGIAAMVYTSKVLKDIRGSVIALLYLYCIFFYSCFMRKDILYYYYYGRYIAPYISIVMIFSALALERIKNQIIIVMGIASMMILAPYEKLLITELDDTRVTWDTLEQVTKHIEADKIVFIRREDMKFYYLPVRAITGARCFPYTKNIVDEINTQGDDYYYITSEVIPMNDAVVQYQADYQLSEDNNVYDGEYIPFPLDITKEIKTVTLWKMKARD